MPQIKKSYEQIGVPLSKMTFSPDVPSSALGANEYNAGENVETDIRGVRSVAGDEEILGTVPGTATYISGGFRRGGEFWFIVATTEGKWWASNGVTDWYDITPNGATFSGYTQDTNITEAWNGKVPIFNDGIHPPFFLPDEAGATMVMYKNNIIPQNIGNIVYVSPTTMRIEVSNSGWTTPPFLAGDKILITDVNPYFNGIFTVVSSTTTTVDYLAVPGASYPIGTVGKVSAAYTWNYNPNWKEVRAGFMRIYSTPNVGNILVAGNLTVTDLNDVVTNYPVTVIWSQKFGLDDAPLTWEPSITNVANQLEVPLRGEVLDAFPSNGNLYLSSYWDTVVFTPMNYSTTSAPILGVRLFNQGRGLLSANCWANTDDMVYGIDARDIWVFDGRTFTGIGNQRIKNWFYDQLDHNYADRVYMEANTQKNQIEIYYPDSNADNGVPNKMISYRYDLDCWNPPRDVNHATYACESPIWHYNTDLAKWEFNKASRCMVYARGVLNEFIIQKDQGYNFINGLAINSYFRRDNVRLLKDYSGKILVHRILPEVYNLTNNNVTINPTIDTGLIGKVDITVDGANSVGQAPLQTTGIEVQTNTDYPWAQINQNAHRVNSIEISSNITTPGTIWMCTGVNWQVTEVEDDR